MKDIEIINILKQFDKSFSLKDPSNINHYRNIFVDLWEVYNDFIFKNSKRLRERTKYKDEIKFDNLLTLLKQLGKISKTDKLDKLIMGLVHLDLKLEHSQHHIKSARVSIKKIIKNYENKES
jgi:hypothetical protein